MEEVTLVTDKYDLSGRLLENFLTLRLIMVAIVSWNFVGKYKYKSIVQ